MKTMISSKPLTAPVFSMVKLGLIKDGKMGVIVNRAECIKLALKWTGKN